jgi:hypothetical protein
MSYKKSTPERIKEAGPELAEAVKQLLRAFHQLLPGLRHIAVEDCANINEAPMIARDALRKAGIL